MKLRRIKKCPRCSEPALRVYYRIFPMWMCPDDECACIWGFWSWVLYFHFDGQIVVKENADVQFSNKTGGAYADISEVIESERERLRKNQPCLDKSHWG